MADTYDYFNSISDYKKLVDNLEEEVFFTKLKNKCPDDEEIGRTKEDINVFDIKNGEELTKLYLKGYVISLADVFEKFIKYLLRNTELVLYIVWLYQVTFDNVEWIKLI